MPETAGSDAGGQLPEYDELPVVEGRPAGSSWGLWGEADVLGCLNLLTPQRTVEAASLIRKGSVFLLNWDMTLPDPPLFQRAKLTHAVHWLANEVGHDDEIHGIHHWANRGLAGRAVGEMWNLEQLADDCAADGVYECFLTSAPLNLPSGVASPPNAVALK